MFSAYRTECAIRQKTKAEKKTKRHFCILLLLGNCSKFLSVLFRRSETSISPLFLSFFIRHLSPRFALNKLLVVPLSYSQIQRTCAAQLLYECMSTFNRKMYLLVELDWQCVYHLRPPAAIKSDQPVVGGRIFFACWPTSAKYIRFHSISTAYWKLKIGLVE